MDIPLNYPNGCQIDHNIESLGLLFYYCRVLKAGVLKGRGNGGTLRIPREDWGTLGNIRED